MQVDGVSPVGEAGGDVDDPGPDRNCLGGWLRACGEMTGSPVELRASPSSITGL
jgi:hypothetical protein